jgi:hypothetical protein
MQQSKHTVAIALEDQSNGSAMPISLGIFPVDLFIVSFLFHV